MKKIALPIKKSKLSPHFGDCAHFQFYYEENGLILKDELVPAPVHQPESFPNWLIEKDVTDVIAAGIGLKPIEILSKHKINIFVGVKVEDPGVLIQNFMDGVLETDVNLCDH